MTSVEDRGGRYSILEHVTLTSPEGVEHSVPHVDIFVVSSLLVTISRL